MLDNLDRFVDKQIVRNNIVFSSEDLARAEKNIKKLNLAGFFLVSIGALFLYAGYDMEGWFFVQLMLFSSFSAVALFVLLFIFIERKRSVSKIQASKINRASLLKSKRRIGILIPLSLIAGSLIYHIFLKGRIEGNTEAVLVAILMGILSGLGIVVLYLSLFKRKFMVKSILISPTNNIGIDSLVHNSSNYTSEMKGESFEGNDQQESGNWYARHKRLAWISICVLIVILYFYITWIFRK